MLQAGFAATCITPVPGDDIPGLFERRLALGVNDPLYARAVVADDGSTCAALVQVDAIAVTEDIVKSARVKATDVCGIPGKNCFIAATHTHSGGPVCEVLMSHDDPLYSLFLAERIATAISEAHRLRRPAVVAAGADRAEGVAFNRRFIMKDGSQRTHPGKMHPGIVAPAGPEDPTVTVVGFRDAATMQPVGCIVNFACHATHMNGYLFSADYVRWVVDTLRAVYGPGFGVVYLNGACGDVTQMDNRNPRPGEFGPYWCERTGRVVAGGALQAFARLDWLRDATVACGATIVRAAVRNAAPDAVKAARRLLAHKAVTAEDVETVYAHELIEVEKMRRHRSVCALEIMGVRIADAFFWGVPGEFFQAFALEVRGASPFPHTCCVELANGYDGYICTRPAFAGGGYEVRTARSSFLRPDAGERIVAAAKRLSRRMFAQAEDEIRSLDARKIWPVEDTSPLDGINQLLDKKRGK
jgi:hypothetical protein